MSMDAPEDLLYSKDHEWVRKTSSEVVTIGVTEFAQNALGEVVYIGLPEVGMVVVASDQVAEVESTKSVSDIHSPLSGLVETVNPEIAASPGKLNSDPYGEGWLFTIRITDSQELAALMKAEAYLDLTGANL